MSSEPKLPPIQPHPIESQIEMQSKQNQDFYKLKGQEDVRAVSWNTPNIEELRVKIELFKEDDLFIIEEYKEYLNNKNKIELNKYVKRMTIVGRTSNLKTYKDKQKNYISYKNKFFKMTNFTDDYDECVIAECLNESINYDFNYLRLNYTEIEDNDRKNEILNYYLKNDLIDNLLTIDSIQYDITDSPVKQFIIKYLNNNEKFLKYLTDTSALIEIIHLMGNIFVNICSNITTITKQSCEILFNYWRFTNFTHFFPTWHKNNQKNNTLLRCNCYVETSGHDKVDLLFDETSADNTEFRTQSHLDKLLVLDTLHHNTIIWDDNKCNHRTPKYFLPKNLPRSFISLYVYSPTKSLTNNTMTNFKTIEIPITRVPNNSNSGYITNGGKSSLIIDISSQFTKKKLLNIAKKLKIKKLNNISKEQVIKEIIKNL